MHLEIVYQRFNSDYMVSEEKRAEKLESCEETANRFRKVVEQEKKKYRNLDLHLKIAEECSFISLFYVDYH